MVGMLLFRVPHGPAFSHLTPFCLVSPFPILLPPPALLQHPVPTVDTRSSLASSGEDRLRKVLCAFSAHFQFYILHLCNRLYIQGALLTNNLLAHQHEAFGITCLFDIMLACLSSTHHPKTGVWEVSFESTLRTTGITAHPVRPTLSKG